MLRYYVDRLREAVTRVRAYFSPRINHASGLISAPVIAGGLSILTVVKASALAGALWYAVSWHNTRVDAAVDRIETKYAQADLLRRKQEEADNDRRAKQNKAAMDKIASEWSTVAADLTQKNEELARVLAAERSRECWSKPVTGNLRSKAIRINGGASRPKSRRQRHAQ